MGRREVAGGEGKENVNGENSCAGRLGQIELTERARHKHTHGTGMGMPVGGGRMVNVREWESGEREFEITGSDRERQGKSVGAEKDLQAGSRQQPEGKAERGMEGTAGSHASLFVLLTPTTAVRAPGGDTRSALPPLLLLSSYLPSDRRLCMLPPIIPLRS